MFLALDCNEASVGAYLDCVGGVVQFWIKDSEGQLLTLLLHHDRLVQLQFVFDANDLDKMKIMEAFDQEDVRAVTWASGGQSFVRGSELLENATKQQWLLLKHCFLVLRKETVFYLCYDKFSEVFFTSELVRLFQPPASDQSRSEGGASEPENGQKFDIHQQSSALENELPVHALSFITGACFNCVPEDTALAEILKNAPHLTKLELLDNPVGPGVSVLASQLENLSKLKKLALFKTEMSEREAADLSRALVHIPHLTALCLISNPLGAGVSVLASQLKNLPELEELNLMNTEMSEREAADLSRALVHIPHLTRLLLGSNPLGAGVSALASQLENLPRLDLLDLQNTEMGEREATDLSRALVHIPHLTNLSLGFNPLGAGVSVLASQLENLPKLQWLQLRNTEMSEREAADLSRALAHIPHLVSLVLDDNPLVGRGIICLAEQIVPHELQSLSLDNTGMDDECKAALVKAKQDRKKAGGIDLWLKFGHVS